MYKKDQLDILGTRFLPLPLPQIPDIKKDPILGKEYLAQPSLATYYLAFNNQKFPTNKKLVRKAIAASIDKQLIVEKVMQGNQIPAYTFTPPPIFGSVDPKEKIGIRFNPKQGKKWLAEAGFPNGEGFPRITYAMNESEEHMQIAQAIQAMLKYYLNIEVDIQVEEWREYLKSTMRPDAPHVFRFGWFADYPDANNWLLDVFHPTKSVNRIRWKNDEFARITEKAQVLSEPEIRKKLYRRAEIILCQEEAAIAPIYFYTAQFLIKPWLKSFKHMPLHGSQIRNWRLELN